MQQRDTFGKVLPYRCNGRMRGQATTFPRESVVFPTGLRHELERPKADGSSETSSSSWGERILRLTISLRAQAPVCSDAWGGSRDSRHDVLGADSVSGIKCPQNRWVPLHVDLRPEFTVSRPCIHGDVCEGDPSVRPQSYRGSRRSVLRSNDRYQGELDFDSLVPNLPEGDKTDLSGSVDMTRSDIALGETGRVRHFRNDRSGIRRYEVFLRGGFTCRLDRMISCTSSNTRALGPDWTKSRNRRRKETGTIRRVAGRRSFSAESKPHAPGTR